MVVLCWQAPVPSDRHVHKIAAFLGAQPTLVSLTADALRDEASIRQLVPTCSCLIVAAETLARAADDVGIKKVHSLINLAKHVLIYGFEPTDRHNAIVKDLSSGGLVRTHPTTDSDATFYVAKGYREWCGQFSGLSVRATDVSRESAFLESSDGRQSVMIRVGDEPFFVRVNSGGSQVFFLGSHEPADLDDKVERRTRPLAWFSNLVPFVMFLRGSLGNRLWHNDHPKACFIIDDPRLTNRYGFLEYRRLLESMRRLRFSACIAFIPWNYRRSSKEVAALVSLNYDLPFLCVHGCDHTKEEFATTDVESLSGKARLSLERMRAHRHLSGVPFDDVMVFPQGRFSAEAVTALKASGYLASVNGAVCPSTRVPRLALRDVLDVAVTRFADFPLFGRRYPHDLAEFAFDLLMGKPAIAVEHHGYFRDGYGPLETFVEGLNSLDERLEWTNLATICSSACLTREAKGGDVYIRFYTSRFRLKNSGTRTQRYVLLKRETETGARRSVTLGGRELESTHEGDKLKMCLSLDPGQVADIEVRSEASDSTDSSWMPTEVHNAKVWIRRLLCEFRDNHVDTARVLG